MMLTTNRSESTRFDNPTTLNLPFTLSQLQLMQAIAENGNFTKAADQLYISQPTASQRIHNLERDLDVILFHRSNQKIKLTNAGEVLLKYSHKIIGLCHEAHRALDEQKHLEACNLVIGASPTLGVYLLPSLIGHFRQFYPQIPVQLQIQPTSEIGKSIAEGQIDLAVVEGEILSEHQPSTVVADESDQEIVLVLPPAHPLAKHESIKTQDLYELAFIVLESQSRTNHVIGENLVRGEIDINKLKVEMTLGSLEAIKNAVQSGLGAAFVPILSIQKELELGVLHQLPIEEISISQKISVLTSCDHYRSPTADTFQQKVLAPYFHKSIK